MENGTVPNLGDDKKRWQMMRQGDKDAFSKIYRQHAEALFSYGLKLTSDQDLLKDAIQALFVEIWNNRVGLAEVENARHYLLKALRFKLLRLSSKRMDFIEPANLGLAEASPEDDWIDAETHSEQSNQLQQALQRLPRRQREILHLRYFQALRHDEIAEMMGINYQSVSNLLHKSLCSLKAVFGGAALGKLL